MTIKIINITTIDQYTSTHNTTRPGYKYNMHAVGRVMIYRYNPF